VDGLGFHHGDVLCAVAEQPGGQRDPGVAAPDDQHLVMLHAVLRVVAGWSLERSGEPQGALRGGAPRLASVRRAAMPPS